MKKLSIIVAAVFIVLILIVGALQVTLKSKLSSIIDKKVIPELEKVLEVDIAIDDASINLLGGSMKFSGVQIGNPNNFDEPSVISVDRCKVNLGVISTLGGLIELTEASVDNAVITIVRNKSNQLNTTEISKSLPQSEKSVDSPAPKAPTETPAEMPTESPSETKPTKPTHTELPAMLAKNINLNAMLEYIDHRLRDEVTRIALKVHLEAKNITTTVNPDIPDGSLTLTTHLDGRPDLYKTNIRAKILPLTNPEKPTFNMEGSIEAIDFQETGLDAWGEDLGVQADSLSIDINLINIDGAYQQPASVLTFKFKNCRPVGKAKEKNPDFPAFPELSVPIKVKGTVMNPELDDLQTAIGNALLANIVNNPDVIKSFLKNKMNKKSSDGQSTNDKINKEVDRGIKSFNKFLKNL